MEQQKQEQICIKIKKNKIKQTQMQTSVLLEIIEPKNETTNEYDTLRAPYLSTEFIPVNLIPPIMKYHFPSSELILAYNDTHGVYRIRIDELLGNNIKNWEYNRPPDMARCPDIARYIYYSKKPVDTMLYLSFSNNKDKFNILDGIHRLTALKIIKEANSKPLNLLEPSDFGSGNDANWLFNQYLLVNIRFNAIQGDLIEAFTNLNKSQTVPDLYIKDYAREKRDAIDTIANEWYVRYKRNFSSASNPQIGNTNRNKFVELLDKIYDKYKIGDSSINELRKKIDNANKTLMSMPLPAKSPIEARVRCSETGCYLFLYKNDYLENFI